MSVKIGDEVAFRNGFDIHEDVCPFCSSKHSDTRKEKEYTYTLIFACGFSYLFDGLSGKAIVKNVCSWINHDQVQDRLELKA